MSQPCVYDCRQKLDKQSFIAGKARDVREGSCATYSFDGREITPYRGEGYVMCQRGSTGDEKLNDREMKWCFEEQPNGMLACSSRSLLAY